MNRYWIRLSCVPLLFKRWHEMVRLKLSIQLLKLILLPTKKTRSKNIIREDPIQSTQPWKTKNVTTAGWSHRRTSLESTWPGGVTTRRGDTGRPVRRAHPQLWTNAMASDTEVLLNDPVLLSKSNETINHHYITNCRPSLTSNILEY